jgi:hypothetical protein
MRAAFLALVLVAALAAGAHAQIWLMSPARQSGGGNPIPPPPCIPGTSNGQMDFSVCSNIGITAALW